MQDKLRVKIYEAYENDDWYDESSLVEPTADLLDTLSTKLAAKAKQLSKEIGGEIIPEIRVISDPSEFFVAIGKSDFLKVEDDGNWVERDVRCAWLYGDGKGNNNCVINRRNGRFEGHQSSKTTVSFNENSVQMFSQFENEMKRVNNSQVVSTYVWRVFIYQPS